VVAVVASSSLSTMPLAGACARVLGVTRVRVTGEHGGRTHDVFVVDD